MKKLFIVFAIVALSGCSNWPLMVSVPFMEGPTTTAEYETEDLNDCSNLPPWKRNADGTCIE